MKFYILTLFVLISSSKLSAQYQNIGRSFEDIMNFHPERKEVIIREGRKEILETLSSEYVYYYFHSYYGYCNEIFIFPKEGYLAYFISFFNDSKEFTKIEDGLWIYTNSNGVIISIKLVKTNSVDGFVVSEVDL
jgi:hypothetical protein